MLYEEINSKRYQEILILLVYFNLIFCYYLAHKSSATHTHTHTYTHILVSWYFLIKKKNYWSRVPLEYCVSFYCNQSESATDYICTLFLDFLPI